MRTRGQHGNHHIDPLNSLFCRVRGVGAVFDQDLYSGWDEIKYTQAVASANEVLSHGPTHIS